MDSLVKKIDAFIEENRENIIRDIARLVAVPSVQGEPCEGAPFGIEARRALDVYAEIGRELGLSCSIENDMLAICETKGEREEYIAIINHLDVVPPLNGWNTDPWTLSQREGWLIGRGVMDDKGPAVISLYIHKFMKENGIPFKYTLRNIGGSNEETDMLDASWYTENFAPPIFGFSSDGSFPVCIGEKGIYNARLSSRKLCGNLIDIKAGEYSNAIPDLAEAVVKCDMAKLPAADKVSIEACGENVKITATGVSGHCAWPEKADSAITRLVDYMMDNGVLTSDEQEYFAYLQKVLHAPDGKLVSIDSDDGVFEPLTIAGAIFAMNEGVVSLTVDCRYNTEITSAQITEKLQAAAGEAAVVDLYFDMPTFYTDPDTPGVKACVETFKQVTGIDRSTFTMAGGTYAREFKNCVSFGPEDDDLVLPEWIGPVHSQNEGYPLKVYEDALKIYILTIIRLQEMEL